MTDKEILQKAVEKALKNKYEPSEFGTDFIRVEDGGCVWFYNNEGEGVCLILEQIIFSHDFAKALWPYREYYPLETQQAWKNHLQQMVLEEEPLKYIERYL